MKGVSPQRNNINAEAKRTVVYVAQIYSVVPRPRQKMITEKVKQKTKKFKDQKHSSVCLKSFLG